MVHHLFLQETKQVLPFRKDLVIRNPAVTRNLLDMINFMINMIFILFLLYNLGKGRREFSLIVLTHNLTFTFYNCCLAYGLLHTGYRSQVTGYRLQVTGYRLQYSM
jgi:hypothetical protein